MLQARICYLCRRRRAFFSPENVPYADLSVHFSVRKMLPIQTSACIFFSIWIKCSRCRRQCAFFNLEKCSRCRRQCAFFNPEKMFPMQTSACIFQSGRCYLYRRQRAFFSPENVPYADLSVHFSVRKMFRMQISACTFQSGRCMGLGHEGLRVIRADIDHQPAS